MKVLLINPPSQNEHIPENPPLGLLYLASVLREEHDVWVIDLDALKYDWKQIKSRLVKENPDFIGLSCTTYTYDSMKRVCKLIRKDLPKTKIIIGGAHITAKPEISLKETRADFAVVGEGEIVIKKIINNQLKNKIIYGKKFDNLDGIPFPSRDLLEPDITYYSGNLPKHTSPETVMLWSRGCPHNCLFCSNPVYKKQKPRFRSPKNIVKEIKELKRAGIKEIFVYDDELVGLNKEQNEWIEKICKLIIKNKIEIIFKCQGRCSKSVNLNTLELMKKAGFKTIMWGCESGSNSVLIAIGKGVTKEDIKRAIILCKKAGIEAWMFLMIGNYKEKPGDVKKTISLLKECNPHYIQVTYATPYPSEFESICEKQGWIIEKDRSKWNTNKPVIRTEHLTQNDLIKWREKIFNSYRINNLAKGDIPKNKIEKHLRILRQTYRNQGLKIALKQAIGFIKRFIKENVQQ